MTGPPPDPTRLELIADDLGIGPEHLRVWLRTEIMRRELGTQPPELGASLRVDVLESRERVVEVARRA